MGEERRELFCELWGFDLSVTWFEVLLRAFVGGGCAGDDAGVGRRLVALVDLGHERVLLILELQLLLVADHVALVLAEGRLRALVSSIFTLIIRDGLEVGALPSLLQVLRRAVEEAPRRYLSRNWLLIHLDYDVLGGVRHRAHKLLLFLGAVLGEFDKSKLHLIFFYASALLVGIGSVVRNLGFLQFELLDAGVETFLASLEKQLLVLLVHTIKLRNNFLIFLFLILRFDLDFTFVLRLSRIQCLNIFGVDIAYGLIRHYYTE